MFHASRVAFLFFFFQLTAFSALQDFVLMEPPVLNRPPATSVNVLQASLEHSVKRVCYKY